MLDFWSLSSEEPDKNISLAFTIGEKVNFNERYKNIINISQEFLMY